MAKSFSKSDIVGEKRFIGIMSYSSMLGLEEKMNGDVVGTRNAMYMYVDSLGWQIIKVYNPLTFEVLKNGYIGGRGYYVVIDNEEGFPIDTDSVITYRDGEEIFAEGIVSIERMKILTDPPKLSPKWSLFTKNKITSKKIMIKLYGKEFL